MSRRYTPAEKSAALQTLAALGGNVFLASRKTGIPERTLSWWKRRYSSSYEKTQQQQENEAQQQQQQTPPASPAAPLTEEQERQTFITLRRRLIDEVVKLSESLTDNLEFASLNQRSAALSRLLAQINDLRTLQADPHDDKIQVEFIRDDGSISHLPPWIEQAEPEDVEEGAKLWETEEE